MSDTDWHVSDWVELLSATWGLNSSHRVRESWDRGSAAVGFPAQDRSVSGAPYHILALLGRCISLAVSHSPCDPHCSLLSCEGDAAAGLPYLPGLASPSLACTRQQEGPGQGRSLWINKLQNPEL